MSLRENLKRLEEMAFFGSTDSEIEQYFGCQLTSELKRVVQSARERAKLMLPRLSVEAPPQISIGWTDYCSEAEEM